MTAEELFRPVPPAVVATCCVCRTLTSAPIAVRYIETASGPGHTLYVCPDHIYGVELGMTTRAELRTRP
ncbi:hypothetical protein AB0I22_06205 [Streptomyces sp. NPDC050610]|uniref:hypothetical protein n=1 Tax=Streptomyces sp. NPDC050610 TaxID=3157097 RepID=UPI0034195506